MGKALRSNATQTTGRTKVLGVPNNGLTVPSVPRAGLSVPGTQLNPQSSQGASSLKETNRSPNYASAN